MTFVTVEDQTTPPPPILDTPVYGRSSDEIIESVAIDSKRHEMQMSEESSCRVELLQLSPTEP